MTRPVTALLVACLAGAGLARASEDPAAAYRLATELLRQGRVEQARRALADLAEGPPGSEVADDALLDLARLDFPATDPEDLDRGDAPGALAARDLLQRVLHERPESDRAAEARYRLALVHMAPGAPTYDLPRARELLLEVAASDPASSRARAARRACAVVELALSRPGAALLQVEALLERDPSGAEADRARLDAADAYLRLGLPREAFVVLSRLQAPGVEAGAADRALDLLTLLGRLEVPGLEPAAAYRDDLSFGSPTDLPRVLSLVVDRSGGIHLLLEGELGIWTLDPSGAAVATEPPGGERRLFRRPDGGVGRVTPGAVEAGGTVEPLRTAGGDSRPVDDLTSAAELPDGSFWVLDGRGKEILRVSGDGGVAGTVDVPGKAVALAADRRGRVHVLDGKRRTVTRYHSDETIEAKLGPRGPGYELREPVDLAVDDAYHLYVLDAGAGRVLIFRDGEFLAGVPAGEEGLREPTALAVDDAGRIYVYERGARRLRRLR